MTSVLLLVGSLRSASVNRRLAGVIERHFPEGWEATHFDLGTLPLYNEDLEGEHTPQSVAEFRAAIRAADAVYWVIPEYNYGTPGLVKNAIDWGSRPMMPINPWNGKPMNVAVATMSPTNGIRGLVETKRTLGYVGAVVVQQFDFVLQQAATKFVESEGVESLEPASLATLKFSLAALERVMAANYGATVSANWNAFVASMK
jgi:chromate reductase